MKDKPTEACYDETVTPEQDARFYKVYYNKKYLGTVPWKIKNKYLEILNITLGKDDVVSFDIDFKLMEQEK